ncbi:MAG: ribonuclease HII [Balneolales bacterium]|nr:ribonuclease HII [Balneolales bacterium]
MAKTHKVKTKVTTAQKKGEAGSDSDLYSIERELSREGFSRIMGLDEVGRGCLAGPVVAAGVILGEDFDVDGIRDSKLIKRKAEREHLAALIKEKAMYWAIQSCTPVEIDQMNILWASLQAMRKCTLKAQPAPDYLLIDGNRYLPEVIPHQCLVKGDGRSASIAAASILAKTYRDEYMLNLHDKHPFYGWDTNVGYPTKVHYEGLKKYGYTAHHRRSFRLNTNQEAVSPE